MTGLPSDLYHRCRDTLLKCSEFDSDAQLRRVFLTAELYPFRNRLPSAANKSARVDACLDFLVDRQVRGDQPVLPLFLAALRDRYEPNDAVHNSLVELVEETDKALSTPVMSTLSQVQPETGEHDREETASGSQPKLSRRTQVANVTKHRQLHRRIAEVAVLAGRRNLIDGLVGRILYRRLEEALTKLPEPGVLIIDCSEIDLVDSSTLLVAIGKLLAFNRETDWRKAIAFSNTSEAFQSTLTTVIIIWPDLLNLEVLRDDNRLLALASDRSDEHVWHLLGEISDEERELWHIVNDAGWISIEELTSVSGQETALVASNLQVLLRNRLVWKVEDKGRSSLCSLQNLV